MVTLLKNKKKTKIKNKKKKKKKKNCAIIRDPGSELCQRDENDEVTLCREQETTISHCRRDPFKQNRTARCMHAKEYNVGHLVNGK